MNLNNGDILKAIPGATGAWDWTIYHFGTSSLLTRIRGNFTAGTAQELTTGGTNGKRIRMIILVNRGGASNTIAAATEVSSVTVYESEVFTVSPGKAVYYLDGKWTNSSTSSSGGGVTQEDLDAAIATCEASGSADAAQTAAQAYADAGLAGKANASHTHAQADVTSLVSDLAGKCAGNDSRLSDARTPTAHGHAQSEVTGLVAALAGKSDTGHTHVKSECGLANVDNTADSAKPVSTAQQTALDAKQSTLVSGTNIKTVNGSSLLGSGDLVVGGGTNGYAIAVQALTSSPADGATIYFGMLPKAPVTTAGQSKVYVRTTCTIKRAEIYCFSGTAGTAENWSLYIRKNNTGDTLIATVGAATSERVFSNTALSIAMASGDYFEIKAVNPTWATNPLTCVFGGYIYLEG